MNWSKTIYKSDKVHMNVWLDETFIDESPLAQHVTLLSLTTKDDEQSQKLCDEIELFSVTSSYKSTNQKQIHLSVIARAVAATASHTQIFFFVRKKNSRHDKVKRIVVCSALAQFINPPRYAVDFFSRRWGKFFRICCVPRNKYNKNNARVLYPSPKTCKNNFVFHWTFRLCVIRTWVSVIHPIISIIDCVRAWAHHDVSQQPLASIILLMQHLCDAKNITCDKFVLAQFAMSTDACNGAIWRLQAFLMAWISQ